MFDPVTINVPAKCNCLCWARAVFIEYGGYLCFRWSIHYGWIPHVFYSSDQVTWWSYSPRKPKNGWRVLLDCIWFQGYLEKNDDDKPDFTLTHPKKIPRRVISSIAGGLIWGSAAAVLGAMVMAAWGLFGVLW